MKTKYPGSCHCGAVRFEAEIDLSPPAERSPPEREGVWWTTTFRCNCSYCSKSRYWKAFVPAADFRWLSGREASSTYQFAGKEIDHYFCKTCGIHPFARSTLEQLGGEFYCINIATLDGVDDKVFAAAPIAYEDGRADAWNRPPAVTRYL
jgi:hypothetical protein